MKTLDLDLQDNSKKLLVMMKLAAKVFYGRKLRILKRSNLKMNSGCKDMMPYSALF
jgi:hypothetical protein